MTTPHQKGIRQFIKPGDVTLTPDQARDILDEAHYDKQRPIDDAWVNDLAARMQRGVWGEKRQIAFVVHPDGRYLLINGQHRLEAQVRAKQTITWNVLVTPCSTEAEIGTEFTKYDDEKRRTSRDVIRAMGLTEATGLGDGAMAALYSAIPIIASRLYTQRAYRNLAVERQHDLRQPFVKDYAAPMGHYWGCLARLDAPTRGRFLARGIVAVGLVTIKHQLEKGVQFWTDVATGENLMRGDPAYWLHDVCIRRQVKDQPHVYVAQASVAWNAFYQGHKLHKGPKLPTSKDFQPHVLGTPFTNGKPWNAP